MLRLAAAALLVLTAIAVVGGQRPLLPRMAARSALRRRAEAALVVAGSLLGTAIITGSLIMGDTLDASVRASAFTQLGPVDLVVRSASPDAAAAAESALTAMTAPAVDGVLGLTLAPGAVATPAGAGRRAQPRAQLLEVDFAAAGAFGGNPAATGITGATPAPGHAAISEDLADELSVEPGGRIDAFAFGLPIALEVDRVLPRTGVAGFWEGRDAVSYNVFVAPGTLQAAFVALPPGTPAPPPERLVLVSAAGGVLEGGAASAAAEAAVAAALDGVADVEVEAAKAELLDGAAEAGASFRELFLTIGSFAVLAGTLLLVNIFVMLSDERQGELGMLRAVGMRRADLIRLFLLEGAGYALVAAALGALLGIGVGRVIAAVASGIFASFGGLDLRFAPRATSVAAGFLSGLLISLATILATSFRISRINIIRAIRDLPPDQDARPGAWRLVLLGVAGALFGVAGAAAIADRDPMPALALPPLAVLCLALLAARVVPRRAVLSGSAALVLLYALFADQVLDFEGGDIPVFAVQGVVLTGSAVALLSLNQDVVGTLLRRALGSRNVVARLGLAYPLARRFRTGLTLAMFSLVVFTLVFMSTLANIFGTAVESAVRGEAGGYDLLAATAPSSPLPPAALEDVPGVSDAVELTYALAVIEPPAGEPTVWAVSGFDAAFVAGGPPELEEWDRARWPTEAAVWEAVLADPTLFIADFLFLDERGGPPQRLVEVGETVVVRDRRSGAQVERELAAVSRAGHAFSGAMMSKASLAEVVPGATAHRYYVKAASDSADVAAQLQGRFVSHGLEAEPFRAMVEQNTRTQLQFFNLLRGYLALGLLVGVAGLGVVMVRAVRERRREIGMLRSLGLQARSVRRAFLLEAAFVTLEGVLLGTALALVTARQIIVASDAFGSQNLPFDVPIVELAALLSIAVAAALLATAAPARAAANIRPAVALRIAD